MNGIYELLRIPAVMNSTGKAVVDSWMVIVPEAEFDTAMETETGES